MNTSTLDPVQWAQTLIHSRRTTLPKRLMGPGPNAQQKALILQAASAAPDHEQTLPWRFIDIPSEQRPALAQAFETALRERDPQASAEECAQAREKAERSPWLLLLVVRTGHVPGALADIPAGERLLSAGAAVQNMLLMCTAMELGSGLTSGKAMGSQALRHLFALDQAEQAVCFVNIGHVREPRKARPRPQVGQYYSVLG